MPATGVERSLAAFLDHSGLDLANVYSGTRCWSELREAAGLDTARPDLTSRRCDAEGSFRAQIWRA